MSDVLATPSPSAGAEPVLPRMPTPTGAGWAAAEAEAGRAKRPRVASGPNWPLIIAVAVAVAMFLWATWMTKAVMDLRGDEAPFLSVRLQPLVEEYVQAQARTTTPEAEVTRQTQAFMGALDAELRARGEAGSTIMVAEAVLSKNVPDITDDVRKAVYAKVPVPGAGLTAPAGPLGGGVDGLGR